MSRLVKRCSGRAAVHVDMQLPQRGVVGVAAAFKRREHATQERLGSGGSPFAFVAAALEAFGCYAYNRINQHATESINMLRAAAEITSRCGEVGVVAETVARCPPGDVDHTSWLLK